jgi:hypothetical protein
MGISRRRFVSSLTAVSLTSVLPIVVGQPALAQFQLDKGAAKKCAAAKRMLAKALSDIKKAARQTRSAQKALDSAKAKIKGLRRTLSEQRRLEKSTKRTFIKAKKVWTKSKSSTSESQMNSASRAHVKVQRQITQTEAKLKKENDAKLNASSKLRDARWLARISESRRQGAKDDIRMYCGRLPKPKKKELSGKELD